MIYFDHAATSLPRRESSVAAAVAAASLANPGRGRHEAQRAASSVVDDARRRLRSLTGQAEVVFCSGCTHALNQAIRGWRPRPRRIAMGPMAHNALRRPALATADAVVVLPAKANGMIDLGELTSSWFRDIDLVVVSHGSNVNGIVQPIGELCRLASAEGAKVIVDAAQTVGIWPLDELAEADAIAFSGHKGLAALPGVGVLAFGSHVELDPLVLGGTGSDALDRGNPEAYPQRIEAGTPNLPGIAALDAAVRVAQPSVAQCTGLRDALVSTVEHQGLAVFSGALPVVSLHVSRPFELEQALESVYGIVARAGLQCAPRAHITIGTNAVGTLRLSAAASNSVSELSTLRRAVGELRSYF